jgi:hypothetical protein
LRGTTTAGDELTSAGLQQAARPSKQFVPVVTVRDDRVNDAAARRTSDRCGTPTVRIDARTVRGRRQADTLDRNTAMPERLKGKEQRASAERRSQDLV